MNNILKRSLSMVLALVMIIGMLPVSVFAAEVGETATTKTNTAPADEANAVWVLNESTLVNSNPRTTCGYNEHTHDDDCYTKNCDHAGATLNGHFQSCYGGSWEVCQHEAGDTNSHTGAVTIDSSIFENYSQINSELFDAIKSYCEISSFWEMYKLEAAIGRTFCYTIDFNNLICTHVCSEIGGSCYGFSLTCAAETRGTYEEHTHDPSETGCYEYDWTLKADVNNNEVADDVDTYHTVTFDANGGNESYDTQTILTGMNVTAVANPTRTYYNFAGWNADLSAPVTSDLTVTAQWTPITDVNNNNVADEEDTYHAVTFNANGGTGEYTTQYVLTGMTAESVEDPTTENEYYSFNGWSPALTAPITADTEFVAQWKANVDVNGNTTADQEETYTVVYDFNGGMDESGNTSAKYENLPWNAETPVPSMTDVTYSTEGYTFDKWDPVVAENVAAPTEGTTITYKAIWRELDKWQVTFKANGSVYDTQGVYDGEVATFIEAPAAAEDKAFTGWYLDGAEYDFETPVTEDITLVAQYSEVIVRNTTTGVGYADLHKALTECGEGQTVVLLADVDLAGIEWTPVGGWDGSVEFKGNFDGQGYTISNLTIDNTNVTAEKYRAGLFSNLGEGSSVSDLNMVNVTITTTKGGNAGALAGRSGATLTNIHVENVNATAAAGAYVGGVVGITNYYKSGEYGFAWNNVDAKDVTIAFEGTGSNSYGGGLLGGMNPNGARLNTYENCDVTNVTITSENNGWHGGMWGWHGRSGAFNYVKNCSVTNVNITSNNATSASENRIGGICGFVGVSGGLFENVTVNGGTLTANVGYAAGFAPWSYAWGQDTYKDCTVTNVNVTCTDGVAAGFVAASGAGNQTTKCIDCAVIGGTITGKQASGFAGIDRVGNPGGAYILEGCTSNATVKGSEYAAGLIAKASSSYKTLVTDGSKFTGAVSGDGHVCEGVITTHTSEENLVCAHGVPLLYTVTGVTVPTSCVAQIGDVCYSDLSTAVEAANAAVDEEGNPVAVTIELMYDVALDEKLTISNNVTIDGEGYTITWADGYTGTLFDVTGSLTTNDVTIDGENAFTFYSDTTAVEDGQNWYTRFVDVGEEDKAVTANVITNSGTLTLGEGTVIKNITIASDSDNGKTANTETGGYYLMYNDDLAVIYSTAGTVTMNGATITGNAGMILNADNTTTNVTGATIGGNMGAGRNGGLFDLVGGTMTITNSSINGNKAMARCATIIGVTTGAVVTFNSGTIDNNKQLGVGSDTAGSMIVVREGSQFIMNGGSISNNVGGRAGAIASRWAYEDAKIVLNSGVITGNTASNDSWSNATIFLRSAAEIHEGMKIDGAIVVNASPAVLTIDGGNFTGSLSVADGLTAAISGGTYNYDPSEWVVAGYKAYDNGDGTWTVSEHYVAQVGETKYQFLQDAINACENGETVTLLEDITYTEADKVHPCGANSGYDKYGQYYNCIIYTAGEQGATAAENTPSTVNAVLDLNGHSITNTADETFLFVLMDNTKLTITDRVGGGSMNNGNYPVIWTAGTDTLLTIEAGKFTTTGTDLLHVTHSSDMVISGGEFSTSAEDASDLIKRNSNEFNNPNYFQVGSATVTVTGGTFYGFNPENTPDDITDPYTYFNAVTENYTAFEKTEGVWTVEFDYVKWVQAELLAGNSVTLDRDIVVDDSYLNSIPCKSNGEGTYSAVAYGNHGIFNVIGKDVTFDLNGHSITYSSHREDICNKAVVSLFYVTDGSNLTITGDGDVTTYGMANGVYSVAADTKVTIEGGNWNNYPCETCGAYNFFLYASHGGEIYITGGTFAQNVPEGETSYLIVEHGTTKEGTTTSAAGVNYGLTKVEVSGGTFVGMNPEKAVFIDQGNGQAISETNVVAEGYKAYEQTEGAWTVLSDDYRTVTVKVEGNGAVTVNGEAAVEKYFTTDALTIVAAPVIEDGVSKSYVSSITVNGVEQELAYTDYTVSIDAPATDAEIVITFTDCGFVYDEDGKMRFYTGIETPDYETLYNSVITDPAYGENVESVKYLARPAGTYTITIPVLFEYDLPSWINNFGVDDIKIGGTTQSVELKDAWLDVGEEFKTLTEDQLQAQYDTEIQKIKDKIAAIDVSNITWTNYKEVIAQFTAISEELNTLITTMTNEAQYLGYHQFGADYTYTVTDAEGNEVTKTALKDADGNIQEILQVIYDNGAMHLEDDEVIVTLVDDRIPTTIVGGDLTFEYDEYTDDTIMAAITLIDADGNDVEGELNKYITLTGKDVGEYTYTVYYDGSYDYKPATAEFTLTVIKAPSNTDVLNQTVTYGESYDASPVITNKHGVEIDVDTIEFIVGLDVAELDVNGDGVTGLTGKVQLLVPEGLQTILTAVGMGDGATMTLSQLVEFMNNNISLLEQWGITQDMVDTLNEALSALNEVVEAGDMEITIGGTYPTNAGAYLHGAVTVDGNYETSYDVGYIIIKPNAEQVYLDFNYNDANGVFTPELLQYIDLGASAYDDEAFTSLNADATALVNNLYFGIDDEGNVVYTLDGSELGNGAYTQISFIAEFGNEFYYAEPIVRAFIIVPNIDDVQLVDKDGNALDAFTYTFDNTAKELFVTVNGELVDEEITYIGIQTNTNTYNSTEAPKHAGVYTAIVTYVEYDAKGELVGLGADMAVITIEPAESSISVTGGTVEYDGNGHTATVVATGSGVSEPDYTLISGGVTVSGDINEVGLDAIHGNVNVDFPAWLDEILSEQFADAYANGVAAEDVVFKLNQHKATLVELGISEEMIAELINVLSEIPSTVTVTFTDDVTYTEPGYYFYYGIVTDSDHLPSADTGLLIIAKNINRFGMLDTTVPYNGEEQFVNMVNEFGADYFAMIVDRDDYIVNFVIDDDMMYVLDLVEAKLGVEIPDTMSIETIREKYDVDTIVAAIESALNELAALDLPEDAQKMLTAIQTELESLPNVGTITINGALPVDAGEYEVYGLSYSEYYQMEISQAILTIAPIYVVVDDVENGKVYGETDPELTANVSYYSYAGAETFDLETNEYAAIVVEKVEITTLPNNIELTYDVVREAGEDVGTYAMSVENASIIDSKNYEVEVVEDETVFTITPAEISVVIADATKVYGEDDPVNEAVVTVNKGVVDLTVTVVREEGEDVGTYAYDAVYTESDNYIVNETIGSLKITPAEITSVEVTSTHTYNGEAQTATIVVKAGEQVLSESDYTVTGNTETDAGDYTVTVTGTGNYTGTASDEWSIEKAKITVTYDNLTKIYGQEDPKVTYNVEGELQDGEALVIPTDREEGEDVGEYKIGGEAFVFFSNNYEVTTNYGTLTITKATVTITIESNEIAVDAAVPDVVYDITCDGVVTDDELGLQISWDAKANDAGYVTPGEYDYTIGYNDPTEDPDNWDVTVNEAKLTVKLGDYICWNMQTGVYYNDLSYALDDVDGADESGNSTEDELSVETIQMLKDYKEQYVIVATGTTLDLNGFTVTAKFVNAFNGAHVVDYTRTGLLKVATSNIELDTNNVMVPVWNAVDGYMFTNQVINDYGNTVGLTVDGDTAVYKFITFFQDTALLEDGATDNDLSIVARLVWETDDGIAYEDFYYSDGQVSEIITASGKRAFKITITGFEDFENLKFYGVIVSGTGAEFVSNGVAIS